MVADEPPPKVVLLSFQSLSQVKVPTVENDLSDWKYHTGLYTGDNVLIVRDDMLCARNTGRDSCQVGPVSPAPAPRLIQSPHGVLTPIFSRVTQWGH